MAFVIAPSNQVVEVEERRDAEKVGELEVDPEDEYDEVEESETLPERDLEREAERDDEADDDDDDDAEEDDDEPDDERDEADRERD